MLFPSKSKIICSIILSLLLYSPLWAEEFTGKVVGVSDGDTIKVMYLGRAERVRLYGIDCPEKGQAFGNRAKQFTSQMVFGKDVLL
jgi:micrococcal nuclease